MSVHVDGREELVVDAKHEEEQEEKQEEEQEQEQEESTNFLHIGLLITIVDIGLLDW